MTAKTMSAAEFVEKYVISLVFFWLAFVEFAKIWGFLSKALHPETTVFIDVTHHLVSLLIGLITGLVLLLGCRPLVPAKNLQSFVIPLIATFYNLLYFTVSWFPRSWQISLCPPALQKTFIITGLVCIIVIGPLISLWGLLYLGRSFGVFVTMRQVILTGPYRWVRHPMYLGWIFVCLGIALANFSAAYLLLVSLHISFLLYRAHLEESHLSEHSEEYRAYMKRAGFILPKLRYLGSVPPEAKQFKESPASH
jgi:protein-S-isoprenylcysteine O-methyltransferase Ste14